VAIEDLIAKQQELMDKVPHTLRPDSYVKMKRGVQIMESLLLYLNSTGHKPWRPNPLGPGIQANYLALVQDRVNILRTDHFSKREEVPNELYARQLVSGFGVIEETIEYLNSLVNEEPREHRLEELTDVMFFFMEQMILGGFTWEEVEIEYRRKHAVNLKRYEDAAKGDYEWDQRQKGRL
jgi:phosphoribosyl-ATP pyrophosphohydrolase